MNQASAAASFGNILWSWTRQIPRRCELAGPPRIALQGNELPDIRIVVERISCKILQERQLTISRLPEQWSRLGGFQTIHPQERVKPPCNSWHSRKLAFDCYLKICQNCDWTDFAYCLSAF